MNSFHRVRSLTALSLGAIIVACAPSEQPVSETVSAVEAAKSPTEADVLKARAAVKELGGALKGALVPAMKSGGPIEAIGVCNHAAPVIAETVSETHGMTVGRTALRVRNPANAADDWEQAQLIAFAEAIEAGADPMTLERTEIVSADGVETFRYMKPIMLAEICATCHGKEVGPSLEAEIKARYPDDEATGYTPGELRGAFTISKTLTE